MTVVVPANAVVTFVPQKKNALRLRLPDDAGELAELGFRDGDLIVGIDGVEFADEEGMQSSLTATLSKPTAVLEVLRSGVRLSIEFVPKKLFEQLRRAKGYMRPTRR